MSETVSVLSVKGYLEHIADVNDIIIKYEVLSTSTPDVCISALHSIVINLNYDTSINLIFRLAHEISHLIFGDKNSQALYHFSPLCVNYEERVAHYEAVKMIAKYAYKETPKEYRNYVDFMTTLELPSSFELLVIDVLSDMNN